MNYAANTREERGVKFAFKGLFGGYQGRFSIAPYYAAVKTYGDIENRDIWEYDQNLTPEEIGQLLRHVWEMRSAWFDYYFLDENCSYHLLSLLETARPGLRLTDRFPWWAIPSETVRAVSVAGLGPGIGLVHDFSERWRTGVSLLWQFFSCASSATTMKPLSETVSPLPGKASQGSTWSGNGNSATVFPAQRCIGSIIFDPYFPLGHEMLPSRPDDQNIDHNVSK
ncbi:MAG: DUF4105 domain-containing protein [Oryzomonas sp.]|nr:DUF4105 domain-containing protein [Oryzomonas sp.]